MATGAALSSSLLASIWSGCSTKKVTGYQTKFFNSTEFDLVTSLVDTILPKTDSPSASEVGVDQTIDAIIAGVYKAEDKEAYAKRFSTLLAHLNAEASSSSFIKLSSAEKLTVLKNLEESKENVSTDVRQAYMEFKQQTVAFYLSSEEIGEKFLNYLPVPGEYIACISPEDVGGKAWSI